MSRSSVLTHTGALILAMTLVLQASSAGAAASPLWSSAVAFTNVVASSPVAGGGYPANPEYVPGTCGPQQLNSNRSESWIAVKPGTEDLVGEPLATVKATVSGVVLFIVTSPAIKKDGLLLAIGAL